MLLALEGGCELSRKLSALGYKAIAARALGSVAWVILLAKRAGVQEKPADKSPDWLKART
jgi:hypothetical protein